MNPTLDLEARRLLVSAALTAHAARILGGRLPAGAKARNLLALAHRLGGRIEPVRKRYGLRFEPRYPGLTAGPEAVVGGSRLVLACSAFDAEGGALGVVFTALIPGRLPQVSVAPPAAGIPEDWRPIVGPV